MRQILCILFSIFFSTLMFGQCQAYAFVETEDCSSSCTGSAKVDTIGLGPFTYLWSNGQTTQIATNLCQNTQYSVTVIDANACVSSDTLHMLPLPTLNVIITDETCTSCCDGTASILAISGTPPYSYSFAGGVIFSSEDSISGLCPGNIDVCVQDGSGCIVCIADSVNAYSTVGLRKNKEIKLQLYPNPAKDVLTISGDQLSTIKIINVTGKTLLRLDEIESNYIELNISEFSRGVYFISSNLANQEITKKVVFE